MTETIEREPRRPWRHTVHRHVRTRPAVSQAACWVGNTNLVVLLRSCGVGAYV